MWRIWEQAAILSEQSVPPIAAPSRVAALSSAAAFAKWSGAFFIGGAQVQFMVNSEITSDYRVRELLEALNEGIQEPDFIRKKLLEWVGDRVHLIHYSDGEYDVEVC